jgi:2-keto-4-pentenoate hydratase/2-oxohepta-3-ene-1,7-dioic acid hydratase in catechol pathway
MWETALTRGGLLGTTQHHRHVCASETAGWNPEHFVTTGKKVVCVGKNYQKHIVEMAANGFLGEQALWTAEAPKKPTLFLKPTTAYVQEGAAVVLPPKEVGEIHHELELGLVVRWRRVRFLTTWRVPC